MIFVLWDTACAWLLTWYGLATDRFELAALGFLGVVGLPGLAARAPRRFAWLAPLGLAVLSVAGVLVGFALRDPAFRRGFLERAPMLAASLAALPILALALRHRPRFRPATRRRTAVRAAPAPALPAPRVAVEAAAPPPASTPAPARPSCPLCDDRRTVLEGGRAVTCPLCLGGEGRPAEAS